jgi:hypothetical protein
MRELEPPLDRDTTERDAPSRMRAADRSVEGKATSAMNTVDPDERDYHFRDAPGGRGCGVFSYAGSGIGHATDVSRWAS